MKTNFLRAGILCVLLIGTATISSAHFKSTPDMPIHINEQGKLEYKASANGDRVPDFSYCGYMASESAIPTVAVKVTVPVKAGDATARIQNALDYVASLPVDADGFRGAVLLEKGKYEIGGTLYLRNSGVVLRGSGSGEDGTILIATGNDNKGTLIRIAGNDDRILGKSTPLAEEYFPVNATVLTFAQPHGFNVGDKVIVNRPSTKEWLEAIGTDRIGNEMEYNLVAWKPGDFDINWDRTIVAATPTSVTLDVPLTNSLDPKFGGGHVAKYTWNGRIEKVGVENLRCVSVYNESNPKDEDHRWFAVTMDNVSDAWVRRLTAEHFASSAVAVWETAKRITIEDCKSLAPVAEIGNFRRISFQTLGQQVLFQRCYAEFGYHDFAVGFTAPGPNAFVQCWSHMPYNFNGALGGWSTGILFDKMTVEGGSLNYANRNMDSQGAGWSAANSLFWQCRAGQIHCEKPPYAQNWAYGSWTQPYGDGYYALSHTFVKPESIFYAQLEARTGKASPEADKIYVYETDETTGPTAEYAAQMSKKSLEPDMTTDRWIDVIAAKYPLSLDNNGARSIDQIGFAKMETIRPIAPALAVKNGWIVRGDQVIAGGQARSSMWRGTTKPTDMARPGGNINRLVPGRVGRGLTDDLDTLAQDLAEKHTLVYSHFPALWYERRRDDHERAKRANADTWAPFYEQPFSRSGQGEAYDRLSKYDLDKFNPFYWARLKKFADLADEKGLVLWNEHYLQHNIIEEGAHWADYPWRSANNINNLGFVENTRFAGDKRVYMADEFHKISDPVRAKYHHNYVYQSVDNFDGNNGVIHSIASEYTGPTYFIAFWIDQIAGWEKEHGKKVIVSINGTKDVLDDILADPERSKEVGVIEISKWQYRADGSLYAPKGGQSLAQRQYARLEDPGEVSFESIYRAVNEYRTKYPDKAVVYNNAAGAPQNQWAIFMAGGSLARIPYIADARFLTDASTMKAISSDTKNQWILGNAGTGYIVFSDNGTVNLDLNGDKKGYIVRWIDPKTGTISKTVTRIKGGKAVSLTAPGNGTAVAWLSMK